MALAASLIPGFQYEITGGMHEGEVVTIVDNTPFPDGDSLGRQRKVTVLNDMGGEIYILPRLLGDKPVGIASLTNDDRTMVVVPENTSAVLTQAAVVNLTNPLVATTPDEIQAVIAPATRGIVSKPITDPMDSRLDHFRPLRSKVMKKYFKREMSNNQEDVDFLLTFANDEYRAENYGYPANLMFKGDTQSGKTLLVEVLACVWSDMMAERQRENGEVVTFTKPMPIFTLSGSSGVTDFDLFGQPTTFTHPETGVESLVWLPGVADLAARCGGILYLDEVNAMGERVLTSLNSLTDHRHHFVNRNKAILRGDTIMPDIVSAHFDLWIIGTYNEGYRGMVDMNESFTNRFRTLRWGYDTGIELKLGLTATVRLLGDALRTSRSKNAIRTPVGTTALLKLQRDINTFGPVLGLEIFQGMFKAGEKDIVETIIEDRSIIISLNEEQRQKAIEDKNRGVTP